MPLLVMQLFILLYVKVAYSPDLLQFTHWFNFNYLHILSVIVRLVFSHMGCHMTCLLQKIIDQEFQEGHEYRIDKKSLMRLIERLVREGQLKAVRTVIESSHGLKEVSHLVTQSFVQCTVTLTHTHAPHFVHSGEMADIIRNMKWYLYNAHSSVSVFSGGVIVQQLSGYLRYCAIIAACSSDSCSLTLHLVAYVCLKVCFVHCVSSTVLCVCVCMHLLAPAVLCVCVGSSGTLCVGSS